MAWKTFHPDEKNVGKRKKPFLRKKKEIWRLLHPTFLSLFNWFDELFTVQINSLLDFPYSPFFKRSFIKIYFRWLLPLNKNLTYTSFYLRNKTNSIKEARNVENKSISSNLIFVPFVASFFLRQHFVLFSLLLFFNKNSESKNSWRNLYLICQSVFLVFFV